MSARVRIDSWHTQHSLRALLAVATLRFRFGNIPGLKFHKILGTGKGDTFTLNDANKYHWVLLTVWDEDIANELDLHPFVRYMNAICTTHRRLLLQPLSSRGTWAGISPFQTQTPENSDTAILVITRARIKLRWWRYFYSQVPPVIHDLNTQEGLLERFGIGEAPLGLQGTISIWKNSQAINNFAYNTASHKEVIQKTENLDWYAEELFARFSILSDEIVS